MFVRNNVELEILGEDGCKVIRHNTDPLFVLQWFLCIEIGIQLWMSCEKKTKNTLYGKTNNGLADPLKPHFV